MTASALLLLTGFCREIYEVARTTRNPIESHLFGFAARLITRGYQFAAAHAEWAAAWVWINAPEIPLHRPVWESQAFWTVYACMLAGIWLFSGALRRLREIRLLRLHARRIEWEEHVRADARSRRIDDDHRPPSPGPAATTAASPPPEPWHRNVHQGFWWALIMAVVMPLVLEGLKVLLGLAKLPA